MLEEKHKDIGKYGIELKILLETIFILNQFTIINIQTQKEILTIMKVQRQISVIIDFR